MARYQIRTGDNVFIEDVIDKMAENAWKILETWRFFEPAHPSRDDYRRFHDGIQNTLAQSVRTYKLCGLSNLCSDHVESTPFAGASHAMDASPSDKIYHLFPQTTLEAFLDELTQSALESIKHVMNPSLQKETYSTLQIVFQAMLGEYLYRHAECGTTELCVYSSSAPISIWQEDHLRARSSRQ